MSETVFEKFSKEKRKADIDLLVERASLVTNLTFGILTLNVFQLARVKMPCIARLPQKILSQELLDAHTKVSLDDGTCKENDTFHSDL